jgi:hypothetical protein
MVNVTIWSRLELDASINTTIWSCLKSGANINTATWFCLELDADHEFEGKTSKSVLIHLNLQNHTEASLTSINFL